MILHLEVQRATAETGLPGDQNLKCWAEAALKNEIEDAEIVIRIVDTEESKLLNGRYRNKNDPTNVLSFPFRPPPAVSSNLLGDLVICAPIVRREATEQGIALLDHWAHLVVHGCLHLLGYDHQEKEQAEEMEALESRILSGIGVPDPYLGAAD